MPWEPCDPWVEEDEGRSPRYAVAVPRQLAAPGYRGQQQLLWGVAVESEAGGLGQWA